MGQAGMELRRKADSSCLPLTAMLARGAVREEQFVKSNS
jgi:hypothetical protein